MDRVEETPFLGSVLMGSSDLGSGGLFSKRASRALSFYQLCKRSVEATWPIAPHEEAQGLLGHGYVLSIVRLRNMGPPLKHLRWLVTFGLNRLRPMP